MYLEIASQLIALIDKGEIMRNIEEFFKLGMKKDISGLRASITVTVCPEKARVLNLGCGSHVIEGTTCLDYPEIDFDNDKLPYDDNTIDEIHLHHVLEHLKKPVDLIDECNRVLRKGCCVNICVPYYSSNLHPSDLDHKHTFSENTFHYLFDKEYYTKNKAKERMKINLNLIIGVEERCLALLVQLEKI